MSRDLAGASLCGAIVMLAAMADANAAAINTTRSNIKHPSVTATTPQTSAPANAAINTTRSNIKHPSVTATTPGASGPANAAISTTRSNISRPTTGKTAKQADGANSNPHAATH